MVKRREKSGLGRGLSALISDLDARVDVSDATSVVSENRAPRRIPIDTIRPNPDQPRRMFSEDALEELAASIREKGIIQPLILRPDPTDGRFFQIVAGERRWRAAQRAQLHDVPALVRDFDDTEVLEVAIIENIQRTDLNALEEAQGYRELMARFGHTQEKLAQAMGKSRSHIANLLRLLALPEPIQVLVRDGSLTAGHARAVLTSADPVALAQSAVEKGLSVRDVERLAKAGKSAPTKAPRPRPAKAADTIALEDSLSAALGMQVHIQHDTATGEGRLSIRYKDLDALDDLIRVLGG